MRLLKSNISCLKIATTLFIKNFDKTYPPIKRIKITYYRDNRRCDKIYSAIVLSLTIALYIS